jgi:DNA-binding transcriptional LysR family regulator
MNISYFRTYITVVEKESFSEAAKALSLSQPAISFQIQAVEKKYGQTLLNRSGPRIQPTEAGKIFYGYAKQIMKLDRALGESIDELQGVVRGRLVLGASTIPGEYIVPKIIGKFVGRFPDVEPELEISDTAEILEKIKEQDIDIGFVGAPPEPDHLQVEKFVTDNLILVLPPNHPLTTRKSASIAEVIKQPFILRETGSGTRKTIEDALEKHKITHKSINEIMDLGSSQAVLAGVEAGLGVSIISKYAADKALALGVVKTIPFKDIEFRRDLYLVFDKSRFLTRTQKEFIRFALGKQELEL